MMANLEHLFVAVLMQAVIGLLTGNWWAGAAAGAFFFVGREHAQAEYRWIETYGSHRRAYMPWWGWFDRRVWGLHSLWWNMILPALVVVGLACFLTMYSVGDFLTNSVQRLRWSPDMQQ
jgi:hypothetical protein